MAKKNDPLFIIKKDHETIKNLFSSYKTADADEKELIIEKLSEELALHMEMEEEIFYPNIEKISDEATDLIREAIREHDEAKSHLSEIENAEDDSQKDSQITEMEKEVLHHIEEEEDKIFSVAKEIKDDFDSIAEEMFEFKEENGQEIEEE